MKLSVVMPAHNRSEYIEDAILSILKQSFSDLELIVIDDASSDNTVEVVKQIRDPRLRVIENRTKATIPLLRNQGLCEARGEYLAWMDSDDLSLPGRLQHQVEFLDSHPDYGVVGGHYQFFGATDKEYVFPTESEDILALMMCRSPIPNGGSMLRRSVLKEHQIQYRVEYFTAEDYAFWVDLAPLTKFHNLDEKVLLVRTGHQSMMQELFHNESRKRLSRALLAELHQTYFENMGINLSPEEMASFLYYQGCSGPSEALLHERVMDIDELFGRIQEKVAGNAFISEEGVRSALTERRKKWIERHA